MKLNQTDQHYVDTINLLEDFYSFHPEYFAKLSSEEMKDLSDYYFAGRDIDVEDVKVYRKSVLTKDPELEDRAQKALRHFKQIANISSDK